MSKNRRDERFHQHSSATHHAHSDPDALLHAAPHEFVRPVSVLHALYRYYPTCSAYGLEAFTTHGAIGGLSLTVRRILRCTPWATGGIDPVPPGKRVFTPGEEPKIVLLNHPPTSP